MSLWVFSTSLTNFSVSREAVPLPIAIRPTLCFLHRATSTFSDSATLLNGGVGKIAQWSTTLQSSLRRHSIKWQREKVDRKSTRLNSSHVKISYAVFCLKKKTESH